ncbi:MAG TPA: ABC transporter substrate-binding protein [Candidatus Binatia bacterium]|nr:ABC transporter substrate-binding protein [Candidatus Binatia bacterium]
MDRRVRICLVIFGLFSLGASPLCSAEIFRVGFPSLATGFAASWVTSEKGIWRKHDLDVELIYLRGGATTVSALIGGSVDFILGSDVGTVIAILQGAGLTKLGVTTNTLGYSILTQPNIKSIQDLRGKILGITPGRDAAYARLSKILRENGMDPAKDVKFLPLGGGPEGRLAALKTGVIHATMFTPPTDLIGERAGLKVLQKLDVANVGGGLSTTTSFLQKNRSLVMRFLKGYMEGIQYLKAHKSESLKIFSKYTRSQDAAIMAHLYEEITTRVEPGLRPHRDAVRGLLDLVALDYPQAQRLSEKDHWDVSLLDEIQKSGFLDQVSK